ncbi:MAG: hypothetical protein KGZ71_02915 [Desulfobulbaceae bacterium]|nr:hypothetical protein [Desulfobulbaceae bacterium]
MGCLIKIITSDTFWVALGSISTLLAVLYVLYADVIKNKLIPIKLELELLNNFEKVKTIEYIEAKGKLAEVYRVPRFSISKLNYYFHFKLINKNRKRKIDNSKVKFIGIKNPETENILFFNVPRSLTFAPAEEKIEFASFLNYQIVDFLKFTPESSKKLILCLQNDLILEHSEIKPNVKTFVYIEIQAEGMTNELIYEIGILWNGEIGETESLVKENITIDKPEIFIQ